MPAPPWRSHDQGVNSAFQVESLSIADCSELSGRIRSTPSPEWYTPWSTQIQTPFKFFSFPSNLRPLLPPLALSLTPESTKTDGESPVISHYRFPERKICSVWMDNLLVEVPRYLRGPSKWHPAVKGWFAASRSETTRRSPQLSNTRRHARWLPFRFLQIPN